MLSVSGQSYIKVVDCSKSLKIPTTKNNGHIRILSGIDKKKKKTGCLSGIDKRVYSV